MLWLYTDASFCPPWSHTFTERENPYSLTLKKLLHSVEGTKYDPGDAKKPSLNKHLQKHDENRLP